MSCAGNGYLSGNMLVPYPFEDGQCLAWSRDAAEAQLALNRCVVDACVCVTEHSIPAGGWPSLAVVSLTGRRLRMRLRACGHEALIVSDAVDGAKPFPVCIGSADWGSYVVVVSSEGISDFISFCNEHSISPPAPGSSSPQGQDGGSWLRLCPRCVAVRPRQLESIRVLDGVNPPVFGRSVRSYSAGDICWHRGFHRCVSPVSEGDAWRASSWEPVGISDFAPSFALRGDVAARPGNNMLLSEPASSGIQLNAMPGAGLGVVSCGCQGRSEEVSPIMSPDGHTRLFNDTCYDLEPAGFNTITVDGEERLSRDLKIHVKCTSCCTCSMYESIVNDRLKDLADAIRTAKSDMEGHLSAYEDAVDRFNRRMATPTLEDVTMSLSGMPMGKNVGSRPSGGIAGRMNRCAFSAVVRNSSYATLSATIYSMSGTDEIVEASASWTDESGASKTMPKDSAMAIMGNEFAIPPGKSLAVTFVSVKKRMAGSVSTGGYTGSMSVGLSYASSSGEAKSLGTLSKTVEV